MSNIIRLDCLRVNQPIGTFYIGAMSFSNIKKISYADIRRIEQRDVEKHLGVQRELSQSRVNEIKTYVNTLDASFPTSIILSLKPEYIDDFVEHENGLITISIIDDPKALQIIDGQHRIAGLEGFSGKKFDVNVSIFIDIDLEEQAILFSTINIKQTKVHKSLVYDLSLAFKARNPIKTCHQIAKVLNKREDSPFKDKIKILGSLSRSDSQTLTQATFIESLVKYISGSEKQIIIDRDLLKRNEPLIYANDEISKKLIFRNMFIDERDADIAKILRNYFNSIQKKWPGAWENSSYALSKSLGFKPLMKFLRDIYVHTDSVGEILTSDNFYEILDTINLTNKDFKIDNFSISAAGENEILRLLRENVHW